MQKSKTNEDLRVRRTRKLLQEAMMELTVEKGFSAVTVGDITERAMVNRSTFYRHYLDKYDLLAQYTREVEVLLGAPEAEAERAQHEQNRIPIRLLRLLRHIGEHADFYRVMFGAKGDPEFTEAFREIIKTRFRFLLAQQNETPKPDEPSPDLRVNYIAHADIGVIRWWLDNDQPCTVEQLARWLGHLSSQSAGLTFEWVNHPPPPQPT